MGYIADLIAALTGQIDDPNTQEGQKPGIVREIATAQTALGGAGGSGGGSANVANQLVGNSSLASINTKLGSTIAADITAIRANTAKISQFSFQLAQDSAGTVFLIRTDTVDGTSININAATGLAFSPVGSIELTDPVVAQVTVEQNEYEAQTNNGLNWAIGDTLERIRTISTSTGAVLTTNWYDSSGTLLAATPAIGTDAIDSDRQSLGAIRSISNKIPIGAQSIDTSIAITTAPKTSSTGIVTDGTTAYNLLNSTRIFAPIDVRSYNSASLIVVNSSASSQSLIVKGSYNSAFNVGNLDLYPYDSQIPANNVSQSNPIAFAVPAGQTKRIAVNLADCNYLRLVGATGIVIAGVTASIILSQSPFEPPNVGAILVGTAQADIAAIKGFLAPANLPIDNNVRDSSNPPRFFVQRLVAGVPTYFNIDGTAPSPPPVAPIVPTDKDYAIKYTNYIALNPESGGTLPGDSITLTQIVTLSAPPDVVQSVWKNETNGNTFTPSNALLNLRDYSQYMAILATQTRDNLVNRTQQSQLTNGTISAAIQGGSSTNADNALVVTTRPNSTIESLGAIVGSLPTGSNLIGQVAISQFNPGVSNFVAANQTQIGGAVIAVGTGAATTGTQRVAIAEDSRTRIWDGTNNISIKSGGALPTLGDTAIVVAPRATVTSQIGSVNPAADTPIPLSSRIRGIAFTNTTASAVFVGIYNSATPLTTGTAPSLGYVIRVPAGATLDKTTADFGEMGRFFANNTRIGLSSTFATYTPLTAPNLALCSLNLEIV